MKEQYCAREQRLDWMLPVSRDASEGVVQSSDPINRMKSLRWYQRAPKLPLTPQGSSTFIQRQSRGFWLNPVPGRYQDSGLMHLCDMPAMGRRQPNQRAEILRMVNSGKTSAAEAARMSGIHRSSVSRSRLISQGRAEKVTVVRQNSDLPINSVAILGRTQICFAGKSAYHYRKAKLYGR